MPKHTKMVSNSYPSSETHEVFNQAKPFESINLFSSDQPLREIFKRRNVELDSTSLVQLGEILSKPEWINKGFQANENTPKFHSHNRFGQRIDEIEFHPAYHDLMRLAIQHKIHAYPWIHKNKENAHLIRMGLFYMHSQIEAGTGCPLSMTFACVPALQKNKNVAEEWLPRIVSNAYDHSNRVSSNKTGATIGMAMTEKQGGTDVRANTTLAKHVGNDVYELTGHKWFCSAPMCDAFLTLAQTEKGLTCFLVPRWKPDGSKNAFYIQRIKDKLGNKSNASAEIEYRGAFAQILGEEGRGVPTIIEMVGLTRYDCMIGSTALMRRAVSEVIHHISRRKVMGRLLIDQPLMQNVVADLCLEFEGALAMTTRASYSLDHSTAEENLLLRLLLPIGKYWICKRATQLAGEAMECLGGNGYVEQTILPRIYREVPVNSIWEGSGNVQCLDILRALDKSPEILAVYFNELDKAKGKNSSFDDYVRHLKIEIPKMLENPFSARILAEKLAKGFQACQLILNENSLVADAYCETRLKENYLQFGTLANGIFAKEIIERSRMA